MLASLMLAGRKRKREKGERETPFTPPLQA
jgi:hypothetical protein